MSNAAPQSPALITWQLAQALWVGGMWGAQFVLPAVLQKVGLAARLIEETLALLMPAMAAIALVCISLQLLVLFWVSGAASIWRGRQGRLLIAAVLLAVAHLLIQQWLPGKVLWLMYSALALAMTGLMLLLQSAPLSQK